MTITNKVSLKSVNGGNTPIADVVDAPTIGTATAGTESATVAYTAAATGGAATSFTAISTPGSITGTGSSPITVSGLTGGTSYTFKVYGTNASGAWSAVQSSASNSVTPAVATSFESIATVTASGSSNTITFSSIPSTYKSLQIRGNLRVTSAGDTSMRSMLIQLNGSTSTTTSYHYIRSHDNSITAGSNAGTTSIYADVLVPTGSGVAPVYGAFYMDLIDYASTSKNKVMKMWYGGLHSGYSADDTHTYQSAMWISTSAVNSLTFSSSFNFVSGSTIALYGVK